MGSEQIWTPNVAYAVGLLTTDGCLSSDGRHIDLTSKDLEQLKNFLICIGKDILIGTKLSGSGSISNRVQFSDVRFYRFLVNIGLTPHKSKTLRNLIIPEEFFFDFLRGHFDGDGSFYAYKDTRWKNSLSYYLCFVSASKEHIEWVREKIDSRVNVKGHITHPRNKAIYQLKYAKREALELIPKLYYNKGVICLTRKRSKISDTLEADGKLLGW